MFFKSDAGLLCYEVHGHKAPLKLYLFNGVGFDGSMFDSQPTTTTTASESW